MASSNHAVVIGPAEAGDVERIGRLALANRPRVGTADERLELEALARAGRGWLDQRPRSVLLMRYRDFDAD